MYEPPHPHSYMFATSHWLVAHIGQHIAGAMHWLEVVLSDRATPISSPCVSKDQTTHVEGTHSDTRDAGSLGDLTLHWDIFASWRLSRRPRLPPYVDVSNGWIAIR